MDTYPAGRGGADAGSAARAGAAATDRVERLAEIVAAVVRQALSDRGARRVALIDDGGPEAELAAEWLIARLPAGTVIRVSEAEAGLESLLQLRRPEAEASRLRIEGLRLSARLVENALVANPLNRTAMLLSGAPPPDPLLPLADLYASEVEELTGRWSAPLPVTELARRAGGVAVLDAALRARLEGRDPAGLAALPDHVAAEVAAALARGRAARRSPWTVPKIGYRTLGVDLFD